VLGDSPNALEALDAQARRLMAVFARAGYEHVAPAVIQPAGLFLDVVGEGLRARTYVFTDPDGEELCLRPDLTVPTCRLHLARHPGGRVPARYCYSGSAFRYQPLGAGSAHPREFRQAGVECFADRRLGRQAQDPSAQCGDVLIRDRLGNWTYQFAVSVDDFRQGIDLVIRGEDLLASTGRQIRIARLLGRDQPSTFLHHALIMKSPRQKLSKSDDDTGIRDLRARGMSADGIRSAARRIIQPCQ